MNQRFHTRLVESRPSQVGLGGEEGGPPGHGMKDHSDVASLIRKARPEFTATFSADGY